MYTRQKSSEKLIQFILIFFNFLFDELQIKAHQDEEQIILQQYEIENEDELILKNFIFFLLSVLCHIVGMYSYHGNVVNLYLHGLCCST